MAILGIGRHPYIDLERYMDLEELEALDDEVTYGMTQVKTTYTGGSHKTMGIVPPSLEGEPYADYGQVIAGFSRKEFDAFISLADNPSDFGRDAFRQYSFGEEQEHDLSQKQMLYLKFKYGVYFPWQHFVELIPTSNWEDKSNGDGKAFTSEARRHFPRLIRFVSSLPFQVVGRCNILGLEANHHGTVHQDGDGGAPFADHFVTLCPRRNKRLFLWDEEAREKFLVLSRAYWFNDHGYHGVEAAPFFRYSIRVDGVFRDDFLRTLVSDWGSLASTPLSHL